jgi:hypothetical protein
VNHLRHRGISSISLKWQGHVFCALMGTFTHFTFTSTANITIRGGIRGIVELEVLHEIERHIGGKIPIQAFFDLIVGTR